MSPKKASAEQGVASLAEQLRMVVGDFVRSVRSASGTASTAHTETLALLYRQGPANIAQLAGARQVKHQSMRLVIGRLQQLGWVELRPGRLDRRSQEVVLTPAGKRAVEADMASRSALLSERLASRLDAAERETLRQALGLMARLSQP